MGHAMLCRWLETKAVSIITVVTPDKETLRGLEQQGVRYAPDTAALNDAPDVIMFAVRPQILGEVLKDYARFSSALFMSVAAGTKLSFYEEKLGAQARIVRAMPNLTSKYGEGATLLVKNARTTDADKHTAEHLMSALGMVAWLDDENLMNAATALSGSGPAYFYLLADIMGEVGAELGLPAHLAQQLARQTFVGSTRFWQEDVNVPAATLHHNMTMIGGTTKAAIDCLQDKDALKNLMRAALKAAIQRSKELAG